MLSKLGGERDGKMISRRRFGCSGYKIVAFVSHTKCTQALLRGGSRLVVAVFPNRDCCPLFQFGLLQFMTCLGGTQDF